MYAPAYDPISAVYCLGAKTARYVASLLFELPPDQRSEFRAVYLRNYGSGPYNYMVDHWVGWAEGRVYPTLTNLVRLAEVAREVFTNEQKELVLTSLLAESASRFTIPEMSRVAFFVDDPKEEVKNKLKNRLRNKILAISTDSLQDRFSYGLGLLDNSLRLFFNDEKLTAKVHQEIFDETKRAIQLFLSEPNFSEAISKGIEQALLERKSAVEKDIGHRAFYRTGFEIKNFGIKADITLDIVEDYDMP